MEQKNLVFTYITVSGPGGQPVKTWMLLPFGPTPLLQAMWSPPMQTLICQWDSIKKNLVDVPKTNKQGKQTGSQERQLEQYHMMNITDTAAIQAILDSFVVNYDGQDWKLEMAPEETDQRTDQLVSADQELESVASV